MKIRLQFFSRLGDLVGESNTQIEVPEQTTAAGLLESVYGKWPSLRDWDKSILVASGVDFVDRAYVLKPGDEIAIMPPVQGG